MLDLAAVGGIGATFVAATWLGPALVGCCQPPAAPKAGGTSTKPLLGFSDSDGGARILRSGVQAEATEVAVSPMRFWALFVYCLGSFFQNVVWIQFSTIVPQTVEYYHVSTDAVNFLVVLGGIFYVPCSFAVTPLIERFGVRAVTIGNNLLLLLAVCARLPATGPASYHWIIVGQSLNAAAGATVCLLGPIDCLLAGRRPMRACPMNSP
eukprot:SAG22_NODE_2322_length_2717_cov_5.829641_1_plen_209_part_00